MNEHFIFLLLLFAADWQSLRIPVSVAHSCTDAPLLLANLWKSYTHTKHPKFLKWFKIILQQFTWRTVEKMKKNVAIDKFSTVISLITFGPVKIAIFPKVTFKHRVLVWVWVWELCARCISIYCQNVRKRLPFASFFSFFFWFEILIFSYYFTWTISWSSILSHDWLRIPYTSFWSENTEQKKEKYTTFKLCTCRNERIFWLYWAFRFDSNVVDIKMSMFRFWTDNQGYKKWKRVHTHTHAQDKERERKSTKCTMYWMCVLHTFLLPFFLDKETKKNLTMHSSDGDKVKAIELCQCLSFLRSRSLFLGVA